MKTIKSNSVTRRSFLTLATIGGASILVPKLAFGDPGIDDSVTNQEPDIVGSTGEIFEYRDLAPTEFEALLLQQAEAEAAEIIEQAKTENSPEPITRARPSYQTIYESVRYVSSGYRNVSGQPAGGTYFSHGGFIYVTDSGGGSITLSVATPWGSIGISVPFGKKVTAGGYGVNIPAGGYYRAQQTVTYACQPYTIWYTDSYGRRSVYRRATTQTKYSQAFRAVRA